MIIIAMFYTVSIYAADNHITTNCRVAEDIGVYKMENEYVFGYSNEPMYMIFDYGNDYRLRKEEHAFYLEKNILLVNKPYEIKSFTTKTNITFDKALIFNDIKVSDTDNIYVEYDYDIEASFFLIIPKKKINVYNKLSSYTSNWKLYDDFYNEIIVNKDTFIVYKFITYKFRELIEDEDYYINLSMYSNENINFSDFYLYENKDYKKNNDFFLSDSNWKFISKLKDLSLPFLYDIGTDSVSQGSKYHYQFILDDAKYARNNYILCCKEIQDLLNCKYKYKYEFPCHMPTKQSKLDINLTGTDRLKIFITGHDIKNMYREFSYLLYDTTIKEGNFIKTFSLNKIPDKKKYFFSDFSNIMSVEIISNNILQINKIQLGD